MVFQDALAALNPAHTVGRQLMEAIRVHDRGVAKEALRARAIELLETVGIPPRSSASTSTRTSSRAACGSA